MLDWSPVPKIPPPNAWQAFCGWVSACLDRWEADRLKRQPYLSRPSETWSEDEREDYDAHCR
jgi:hypothetical protein